MLLSIAHIMYLWAVHFIKGRVNIKITNSYLSCRLYPNVSQWFELGAGQKLHGHVHYKQHEGLSATYNSSYFVSTSHIGDPWPQAVAPSHLGGTPSWVIPHGQHVLSWASWQGSSKHVACKAPPHNKGAHLLFLRPLKRPHKSFILPYRSQLLCCSDVIDLGFSSMLVNFRCWHILPIPHLLLMLSHRVILVHKLQCASLMV